ncbi:MAG TPA: type II toxin-antitoxin system VapC family toxin [Planctomycetota bacterium]|nr:type II toxin-antitoxin system VapC family toxin [Planctomycetota bacterium]
MAKYLIDTDWAIDYLAEKPEAVAAVGGLLEGTVSISAVSVGELCEGAHLSRNPAEKLKSLDAFLSRLAVLDVTELTAHIFGKERARLRQKGRLIENLDLLIAATCLEHDLRLLTNNLAHFERIEGLQIGLAEE